MSSPVYKISTRTAVRTVLIAGLTAGVLDMISASVLFCVILEKGSVLKLWQIVASALIGKSAFEGGGATALLGLLMHYCIAMTFAAGFVWIYPYMPFLRRRKIIAGLLYGIFAFVVMNVIVLPLIGFAPFKFVLVPSTRQLVILMLAVGLPISLITAKYYKPVYKSFM